MSGVDRYIMGLVDNLENLTGTLSEPENITGHLANATLRGMPVELRIDGTILQWKYEDEDVWTDLIDLSTLDYEVLTNLPTIDGVEIKGEIATMIANAMQSLFDAKVDKESGKGLSTNDYTDEEKSKLADIESGAQVNVIESIEVNGDSQVIDNKTINIAVPVNNNELINGAGYQTSADVQSAITAAIADVTSISYHICESNEYNHSTYVPTVVGAIGVIYLVPKPTDVSGDALVGSAVVGTDTVGHENIEANNIYYEYIYNGLNFEKIGDTTVDLTGYLQDADIATAGDVNAMLQEIGIIS